MPILIFITLILSPLPTELLLEKIAKLADYSHNNCLSYLPNDSSARSAFAALLCGENVTDANLKENLVKTSLIHLFVVSGSHLLLLEQFFVFFGFPLYLRLALFALYALACGWQAPLVRCLLGLLLKLFFKARALHWSPDLVILFTGLLALIIFPAWVDSRSLIMSWLASLGIALSAFAVHRTAWRTLFAQSILVALFMIPAIWGFGSLHPLGTIYNLLLAPLVSLVLFPLSLLACVFSFLVPFFEKLYAAFQWISVQSTDMILFEKAPVVSMSVLWLIVLALHLAIHLARVHWRRKRG